MSDYISMNNKVEGDQECLICFDEVITKENYIKYE